MEATEAVEDYLKAVFHLSSEGHAVTTSTLAHRLGVSPPSVTGMVKRLSDQHLVARRPSREIVLTDAGRAVALRTVRRHRLVETLLATTLHVPWDEVHKEAEILEHAISDRLCERIAAHLGEPTHDPHGHPIPPPDGTHEEGSPASLTTAPPGVTFYVERVSDRDSTALRFLGERGIRPGAVLEVVGQDPFDGPKWVLVDDRREALGLRLCDLVLGRVAAAR